jgi:hypothetical protein
VDAGGRQRQFKRQPEQLGGARSFPDKEEVGARAEPGRATQAPSLGSPGGRLRFQFFRFLLPAQLRDYSITFPVALMTCW